MTFYQRNVVEVPFNLPQGVQPHPAIIISCKNANEEEGTLICVMITHNAAEDDFTFKLSQQMFEGKIPPTSCQARLHLISLFAAEKDIITNKYRDVRMKENYFNRMMERILLVTFGYRINIYENLTK